MAVLKYQVNGEWYSLSTGATYEVGDIFISTNATSPAARFGGTWTQLTDRFLVGAGQSYAAGDTGGEDEHTLTKAELPYIYAEFAVPVVGTHAVYGVKGHAYGTTFGTIGETMPAGITGTTQTSGTQYGYGIKFGSDEAHNNMPPYLAVYMWQRIE